MYNLIIKEQAYSDNPYENEIVLHNLSLKEVGEFIKKIERKDNYCYEIINISEE